MSPLLLGLAVMAAWPLLNGILAGYAAAVTGRRARRGRHRDAPPARDATPTKFWVVVPCLNEERVVGRTVRAALALRAPAARTEVLVVDDGSDDGTPQVLAGTHDDRLHVLRRELPHARQGKGSALNAAYRLIRDRTAALGDAPERVVVGIIDGDGRGSANLLAEVSSALRDPQAGAVQCRVRIHNRNRVLGMVQDLELGSVADASQVLRDTLGSVELGGNGQFTRLSVLARLGESPWSDCLVEDLELGLQLHLASVRIRYVSQASVAQQGVVNLRRLLRQRTRWAQGNLQCARYLGRLFAARRIRNHTFVEMSYYLVAPWLNAVGAVLVGTLWGFLAIRAATSAAALSGLLALGLVLALWASVMIMPGMLWATVHRWRLRDERTRRCLLGGVVYPMLLLLGLVSTWRAVGRQLAGRRSWVKTERLAETAPELNDSTLVGAR